MDNLLTSTLAQSLFPTILRIYGLSPKPVPQAAQDFADAIAKWTAETGKIPPDYVNNAYTVLRAALAERAGK